MELIQDRLDVRNKTRANIFNWRGQFTPQFVDYILEKFIPNGGVVCDPYSGSGTVLQECARRGLSCYGYEINPAAYAMSKFFGFCNIPLQERMVLGSRFKHDLTNIITSYSRLPVFTEKHSFRDSYINLLELTRECFSQITDPEERILVINTLFNAEDCKNSSIASTVSRSLSYIINCLMQLPFTNQPIIASLADARSLHKVCPVNLDLIFTSPPYINVFNYHQNHRAILEVLGWDMLKVAQSEIGSNRKNRGNRFKTVVQYCLDMELTLSSFWQCLVNNGLIVIVIGRQSNVRKVPFFNSNIVKDIAVNMESFSEVHNSTRTFVNKFGLDIKEDILVFKKSPHQPVSNIARTVAFQHLHQALVNAPYEAQQGIIETLSSIEDITSSPFFLKGG